MSLSADFSGATEEVVVLLDLIDESSVSTLRQNAICRSATVLLVSHFESFVKSLAEQFIDDISTGEIPAKAIPVGIRELHSRPRMEEIVSNPAQKQREALFRKYVAYNCLWVDDAKPPQGLLEPHKLRRTVTSAKSDVIDALFELMGAKSPVCDGDIDIAYGNEDDPEPVSIRLMLRDVTKCRDDIAHGNDGRIPTPQDVKRYRSQLLALAGRLEAKSAQLTKAITSA
ncbi:MAE_28990/MAE_18760 family HEPN-like nuclease [Janibacter indicus]|uniref:MAE_28990/MAE_18760 family HEPN-like nuclease n=1 Tax=Janibacter indicus TaxID=857417 RepID=UPI000F77695D|nr:MAE_28990/MAE_18760 family HEPN-like nuclease [Janibacter indicus]